MTELASLPFAAPKAGLSQRGHVETPDRALAHLAREHEGLKILWMAVTPPLMFHSKGPIRKIEDFKGLRVRYAGAQFKAIIDALGAVPLLVPPQETQDALSKGIIDAATFPVRRRGELRSRHGGEIHAGAGHQLGDLRGGHEPGQVRRRFPTDLKSVDRQDHGPGARPRSSARMWDEAEMRGQEELDAPRACSHDPVRRTNSPR